MCCTNKITKFLYSIKFSVLSDNQFYFLSLQGYSYFTLYHVLSNERFDDIDLEFDWNEDDEEGLKKMFPKLWDMYGEEPIEW